MHAGWKSQTCWVAGLTVLSAVPLLAPEQHSPNLTSERWPAHWIASLGCQAQTGSGSIQGTIKDREPRQSRIIELRFFGGLPVEECAEALGISPATVRREWAFAQAWLFRPIEGTREP